jgi:prepilin-type N-terminal cleavage/methylation domain-containing protein
MNTKKLSSGGFTLVELLVTIAVAGIVVGSMNQVVTTYVHTSQRGRYLNLANAYAEAKVESLRNIGYNGISLGTSSLTGELPSQLPLVRSASMTTTNPSGGIKQIVISISYKDQGQTNSLSYTTDIGELGVGQ